VKGAVAESLGNTTTSGSRSSFVLRFADLHLHFHRPPCRIGQCFAEICRFQVGIGFENGPSAVPLRKQTNDSSYRDAHASNARLPAHRAAIASDAFESWHVPITDFDERPLPFVQLVSAHCDFPAQVEASFEQGEGAARRASS
jgi:hypothetical protein